MPDSDLEIQVLRLGWRLDALDKWRSGVDGELHELTDGLREVVSADKIEAAVRHAVRNERTLSLTLVQKIAVAFVGAVTVADSLKGLIH